MLTTKEFKVWLVMNDYTQSKLAKELQTTEHTISRYVSSGRFPRQFELSLIALTKEG